MKNKVYNNDDKKNLFIKILKKQNKFLHRYFTDYNFTHINKLIAEYHSKYIDTYFYILKFINTNNIINTSCFELDLLYFYNNNNSYNINYDPELKTKILKYIASFVKTTNPNNKYNKIIKWKEFSSGLVMYFNKEIYMNFFNEYESLIIMNKEYTVNDDI